MARDLTAFLLAAVVALFVLPKVVVAQDACLAGRTFSGECVNPTLANNLTEAAIIYSQPKISETTIPVLPEGDRDYRYPNALIPVLQFPSGAGDSGSP